MTRRCPLRQMPSGRVADDHHSLQIERIASRKLSRVINGASNVEQRVGPTSARVVHAAEFNIPRCNSGTRQRIGQWGHQLQVGESREPATSVYDDRDWMRAIAAR